jgi:hypothetical protein
MKASFSFIILFLSSLSLAAQGRLESLQGNWVIKNFHGPTGDSLTYSIGPGGCTEYLILKFDRRGKARFIFTDKKDTATFSGRLRILKNNGIRFKNNIHEIIYLGELEKCITPVLRIRLRMMFYRTFDFTIKGDELVFHYDFPPPSQIVRTITFKRL